MDKIKQLFPGVLLAFLLALPCYLLGKQFPVVGGPVFAILSGMIIALFYKNPVRTKAGLQYTSKKILQYAVILLGFGMNLSDVAKVGLMSLPIILATITTSLVVAFALYKLMRMPGNISTLIGVGSSICGGSAIAATAPVIGAEDEEVAQAISVIFLFNILAALIFPSLGSALGLSNQGFALFAGTAVNDTSSVTAAASAWDGLHPGANSLETATIVKLTRTLAIIPITLVLAIWKTKKAKNANTGSFSLKKVFPFFILFFLLASVITTIAVMAGISASTFSPLKNLSKFFIIMAMGAIGLNTDIVKLVKSGGKAILLGFCCWVAIALVSLGLQQVLGIM